MFLDNFHSIKRAFFSQSIPQNLQQTMSSLRQRPSNFDASLPPPDPPSQPPPPPRQSALSQALESSAHLANLLPTGTLLAFQLLTPIFTNNGYCDTATRPMTLILLILLSMSCFLASFTDSIKASDGQVFYGLATFNGIWVFDSINAEASGGLPDLSKFRLGFIDFVHAVLSVLVFVAVGLRDKNVVTCFYPLPGRQVQEVLDIVPMGIGVVSSLLFVMFPTTRHGIGYPVTRDR